MRWFLVAVAAGGLWAQDAREIVRKSVEADQFNWLQARDYVWVRRVETRDLDGHSHGSQTFETSILYGRPYNRLVERNDQPLPPDEQRKQQQRLEKTAQERQRESPARRADREKARERQREFLRDVPDIYDLSVQREDTLDGHSVWVIGATPKSRYPSQSRESKLLAKFRGRLWIDKTDYEWVRVEAEAIQPVTWGLFLVKLNPGSTVTLEETRVNNEVWLPKKQLIRISARLGFKRFDMEQEVTFRDYRKFQANSTLVAPARNK